MEDHRAAEIIDALDKIVAQLSQIADELNVMNRRLEDK